MTEKNQNEEMPQPEIKMEEKNNEINSYIEEGNRPKLLSLENQIVNNGENKDGDITNTKITKEKTVIATITEELKKEPERTHFEKV
jgi:hypothetical protein